MSTRRALAAHLLPAEPPESVAMGSGLPYRCMLWPDNSTICFPRRRGTRGGFGLPMETEPVAKVQGGRLAEVRPGNLPSHLAVEVNVDRPLDADVAGQQAVAPLMIQPSSTR